MTFRESIRSGFSQYFRYKGRATRSEYWYFFLFVLLLTMLSKLTRFIEKSCFTYSMGYMHGLQTQLDLHHVDKPLATIPGVIAIMVCFLIAAMFALAVAIGLLAAILPLFAVQVRRLHDTGRSGWWVLGANLAWSAGTAILAAGLQAHQPIIGITTALVAIGCFMVPLAVVYFLAQPGDRNDNKYGYYN